MSSGSKRALDRAHRGERRLAELGLEILHLALADAMLAGAGAVHRQRALDQPFDEDRCARAISAASSMSTSSADVEIAVADMADDRRRADRSRRCRAGFRSTHSASREIGTQTSVARCARPAAGALRPIGVMPRLPQSGAVLGRVAQSNGPPPNSARDFAEPLRLLGDACFASREIRATTSASPATPASNRRWTRAPATHRAVRSAPPECRTGWS